ncbi:MAG: chromate transporter [Synergistaceae bacterium]|nr:chromate transporter [Synergistaceae bacterium]MBQ7069607.1 chromate transporter [Synergistaceae bacterium]MBR0079239.1 chromate transporter [Synergistaceae bacterium]MBR0234805.1 chromate transporter [Synergistaceae bacterium]MBR0253022.1 chromate transporter [Synergistaceae bacterium]
MKILIDLFLTFTKIGAVTFGGGYAMLPILQREIVENKKWGTEEELADYYAIGQCTPGVIAVNVATFIGRKIAGNLGGVIATIGVVFPSVVIISLLAGVIQAYSELEWVKHAFAGIRVCVCVLIFNAVIKLFKKAIIDIKTLCIYILILSGSIMFNISPVIFVILAGISGIILKVMSEKS